MEDWREPSRLSIQHWWEEQNNLTWFDFWRSRWVRGGAGRFELDSQPTSHWRWWVWRGSYIWKWRKRRRDGVCWRHTISTTDREKDTKDTRSETWQIWGDRRGGLQGWRGEGGRGDRRRISDSGRVSWEAKRRVCVSSTAQLRFVFFCMSVCVSGFFKK